MKRSKPLYIISGCIFAFFVIFTIMVSKIGIKPLGVNGTDIGFADINVDFHNKTGLHLDMYDLTDKLSIIIYALMAMFAVIWVVKLFMKKFDKTIFMLGILYILLFLFYFLFEHLIINYRPVLIEGVMEASYPSSTTMLATTVLITAVIAFFYLLKSKFTKAILTIIFVAFAAYMVFVRMTCGVHWLTDIIGGLIASAGFIFLYGGFCASVNKPKRRYNRYRR